MPCTPPRSTVCLPIRQGRRRRPLLLGGLGAGVLLAATGCQAAPVAAPPAPPAQASMRWPVPEPPELDARNPVLWVGLASHLRPDTPVELRSGGGLITLVTPDGARYSSPRLVLHWRTVPVDPPLQIRRQVLGPFASYESADEAASRWRAAGVEPLIANPREWEVWAPLSAPLPPGLGPSRSVEQRLDQRAVLELRRDAGPVLLEGPLQLETPGGLYWQGGLFQGPFRLQPDAYGSWALVEEVPLERYLQGVVPHEIGAGSPQAALAAQAVLARTWAVRNRVRFAVDGYHLCADTQCQVYADPRQAGAGVRQAIAATRSQVLTWQGQPIHAVYHATNGGVSAGFEEVWSGAPLPYLLPGVDASQALKARFPLPLANARVPDLLAAGSGFHGADHPRFRWTRTLTAGQIAQALQRVAPQLGTPQEVKVLERGASGRVLALQIQGSGGSTVLRLDAIRRTLRQLPSTLFVVSPSGPGSWRFGGGGFGHGAGLSQAGAIDLARRGWPLQRILQHYYPGTTLQPLSALDTNPHGSAP
ncbi:SpoIID/LytB domain-containing protein [Cyanobium sp. NIES-981]|uniref:SpoIID/LytB domain-containing protein n=1 Tax=Cyanobium sp. NIES-981 TaxID=1851505 RepID=UPI0007DDDDB1|nr:SpoIID/LytB domain-containing protein [Cyanobium sp. NIES-981]SBO44060.1 SpoIID/LytB domain protein [Cyanobium sp. NIES-981]